LEPSSGASVLIPVLGLAAKMRQKFMLIACLNDIGTSGQKELPKNIARHLRFFAYPEPDYDDIVANCKSIASIELGHSESDSSIDDALAERIAVFMHTRNEAIKRREPPPLQLPIWSMRDVRKLFQRVSVVQLEGNASKNLTIPHHILCFVMSSVSLDSRLIFLKEILELLQHPFTLSDECCQALRESFFAVPQIEVETGISYLMKRNAGIMISRPYSRLLSMPMELWSLWDEAFLLLLAHHKELLFFGGGSSFKASW
jgi:hypothetical protein